MALPLRFPSQARFGSAVTQSQAHQIEILEMGGAQKKVWDSYPGSPKQTRFLMDGWMFGDFQPSPK